MRIFDLYAHYYDLMYRDKDYLAEVDYIDRLIQLYKPGAQEILDLGCGTGRHANYFIKKGYRFHGVDLSSVMLEKAIIKEDSGKLCFSQGDIRTIRLNKKFDVVTSLFHVISYQTTNDDIIKSFRTAYEHLMVGGIFLFDCWYGPAVLTERPEVRVKKIDDDNIEVTRVADPLIHPNDNVVDVSYYVFVKEKVTNNIKEFTETHRMRYLFKPEVEMMLSSTGFELVDFNSFLSDRKPDQHTWNVLFVGEKYE